MYRDNDALRGQLQRLHEPTYLCINPALDWRILFRILFRVSRRTRDRKYICSELVYECFRKAGVSFRLGDAYVGPDDIWRDDNVRPRWRIL